MAQVTLVERRIEDGRELVQTLLKSQFSVSAAAWVRADDNEDWQLYIATPGVDQFGKRDAYGIIQNAIRARPDWMIGLLGIKVIDSTSELGQEMIEIAQRHPIKPTLCYGHLGDNEIEEAYVYPEIQP